MSDDRVLYDLPSAAHKLSISERVVARLIKDGDLASVKLGRRRLVPHEALEDYKDRLVRAS